MKKLFNISLILSFFLVVVSFMMADFYSSMTKVDYVEGSKTLKFTTKMNTQHIANALKVEANSSSFKPEVERYVNRNFGVAVNGANKNITITGSQVNGDAVWVYFEVSGVEQISNLRIRNSVLLEVYPKQFNVVNIAYKGKQKTMNFSRGKDTTEVFF